MKAAVGEPLAGEINYNEDLLEGFRACLREEYQELDDEALAELLDRTLAGMTPESAQLWEGLWSKIKKVAKKVGGVVVKAAKTVGSTVSQVLPVAGAALGSVVAPGIGTALGSQLGKLAGQALGQVTTPSQPQATPPSPVAQIPAAVPAISGVPGVQAAAAVPITATTQLLQLLQSPQLLQALGSLGLGAMGQQAIAVGNPANPTSAPPAAFLNLLNSLTQRAAVEAVQLEAASSFSSLPEYLTGSEGEPLCDLANPEARAEILWQQLQQTPSFSGAGLYGEDGGKEDYDEAEDEEGDSLLEWLEEAGLIKGFIPDEEVWKVHWD